MECLLGTIGLLAVAVTTLVACGVALAIALLPQLLERRRFHERAAFLRSQLLHHLSMLPPYLQERDRALPLEQRDRLDEFCCFAQHASLLDMEEWTSVLRTQAMLMTARNRPSFTKREARSAQQTVDHTAAVLRGHVSEPSEPPTWWSSLLPRRNTRPGAPGPGTDRLLKLRDAAG